MLHGPTVLKDDVSQITPIPPAPADKAHRETFADDFRRFFVRGLAALLPTLITILLLVKLWEILWDYLGSHIIWLIKQLSVGPNRPVAEVKSLWDYTLPHWLVELIGVLLAIVLVYVVGLFVGNFIGRTAWRLAETGLMRIPLIRAIYPAVKQVTDFLLADRKHRHLPGSRVVAVQPHASGIWSIGLVTGPGVRFLADSTGQDMLTVFIPSSPTAFSGYVVVVPRENVIELPLTVEEAMRLLLSGGVITPGQSKPAPQPLRQSDHRLPQPQPQPLPLPPAT